MAENATNDPDTASVALEQLLGDHLVLVDCLHHAEACGLSPEMELPRIVIIGEQGSGKTSVFQAISHLLGLTVRDMNGTPMTTELSFEQIKVTNQYRVAMTAWDEEPWQPTNRPRSSHFEESCSLEYLPQVVMQAEQNVDDSFGQLTKNRVLHAKFPSSDYMPLRFVEISNCSAPQTPATREEGLPPRRLLERYLNDKNAIIIVVIPDGSLGEASSRILQVAKDFDPQGSRTIPVVNSTPENQRRLINFMVERDRDHDGAMSWHVLRNFAPKGEELTSFATREATERKYFTSPPWAPVSPFSCGSAMLRKKISHRLADYLREKVPGALADVELHIQGRKFRLRQLGELQLDNDDAPNFMYKAAAQFKELASAAIRGDYRDGFFDGDAGQGLEAARDKTRALRDLVVDLNSTFAYVLSTRGARRRIVRDDQAPGNGLHDASVPLIDLYATGPSGDVRLSQYISEVKEANTGGRMMEQYGGFSGTLAMQLFRQQAAPWEAIARKHIQLVTSSTRTFVETTLSHLLGAHSTVLEAVTLHFVEPFFRERMLALEAKLEELLRHYRSGHVQPLWLDAKRKSYSSETRKGNAIEETVQGMMTYYDRTLQTFTENVIVLALENCLISKVPDMLMDRIGKMSNAELKKVSSGFDQEPQAREALQREIDFLAGVQGICHEYLHRGWKAFPPVSPESPRKEEAAPANKPPHVNVRQEQDTAVTAAQEQDNWLSDPFISSIPDSISAGPKFQLPIRESPAQPNSVRFDTYDINWSPEELRFKDYCLNPSRRNLANRGPPFKKQVMS